MNPRILIMAALILFPGLVEAQTDVHKEKPRLLIRCDDIGMCHAVNLAFAKVIQTGMPVSASVMFTCPWYQEAVDMLKGQVNVSVGVHLTLNAEWKNFRWGPVAGWQAVPSLVDSCGYFFPSRSALFSNNPKIDEVEKELRAQIDRAFKSGLRIDYFDYHMGAAVHTLELRQLVERLATEYHVGISRYFGEVDLGGYYRVPVNEKTDSILYQIHTMPIGAVQLVVFHVGLESPEMDAMIDLNATGLSAMSSHRQAELLALISPEFQQSIHERNVQLFNYRSLIELIGLQNMKRPTLD
jgi:predicted glycoside hydrolase/deacetylase ChbG (UPF0249 family)